MGKTTRLFVSCEQAKHICDKNQYGEATFIELIKLNIRLIYCKITRAYSKRNGKLTKTMNKSNMQSIPSIDKEVMKQKLQEQLTK